VAATAGTGVFQGNPSSITVCVTSDNIYSDTSHGGPATNCHLFPFGG
jgi:hypothetical protein